MCKSVWRAVPASVENGGDELWVGVKGQSDSVIAGSPRNAFWCSVACSPGGGRATGWLRGLTGLLRSAKLRMPFGCGAAVRPRGISFVVERETARIAG